MSDQNQPLQREEPKARSQKPACPNDAMQYLHLTLEPGPNLAPKAPTRTEGGLPIPPSLAVPSHHNDESPPKFCAGQSGQLKSLRPFILSIMAFKNGRKFSKTTSEHRKRRLSSAAEEEGQFGPALTVSYPSLLDQLLSVLLLTRAPEAISWHIGRVLKRPDWTHCSSHP
jgi:hypothetical protein